ncbi:MAG: CRISPR-associated primase-polymerase type A1 [Desulfobacterales bacterium]|nr:CRISPR-associated primase-polymerase type A1 [Desulfobacterales bacterium]
MNAQVHQTSEIKPVAQGGTPNFDLVFSKIEREILEGRKPDLCRQVLQREDIWKKVEPLSQLKWARLAEMAGEVETALKVLAHINNEMPHLKEAWEDRLSLLSCLARDTDLKAALGVAREVFGEESCRQWAGKYEEGHPVPDEIAEAAAVPFERLKRRQEMLLHYLGLFSGREDCFARQWADKAEGKQGYVPVRRGMEIMDVEEHLSGRKTYGIYLVRFDGSVSLAVLDVDLRQEYRGGRLKAEEKALVRREWAYLCLRVGDLTRKIGIKPIQEFSGGKGFHFWFIFDAPISPEESRRALGEIRDTLAPDLKAFSLEVFPKQDKLSGKGLGNLVKLPLGIHRLTGKRSYFLGCSDRSTEAQIQFLMQIKSSSVEALLEHVEKAKCQKVLPHPRLQKWSDGFPELSTLETRCPPIGQIIASCRQGKAISNSEEKVLFQTVGFLRRAKTLMHHLAAFMPEYNPHLVDFKLSRLRGTPLGCKRIHSVLGFTADLCAFDKKGEYEHPLLHLGAGEQGADNKAERVENLGSALDSLKGAIEQVRRFLT